MTLLFRPASANQWTITLFIQFIQPSPALGNLAWPGPLRHSCRTCALALPLQTALALSFFPVQRCGPWRQS